jgi:hypothetical protein
MHTRKDETTQAQRDHLFCFTRKSKHYGAGPRTLLEMQFHQKNIGDAVYLNRACTFCGSYAILKPLNVSLSFNTRNYAQINPNYLEQ